MTTIVKIVIPEESAAELTARVLKNSSATLDGTLEAQGFSITTSLTAAADAARVVFMNTPAPRPFRLENLGISGAVKLTWLKFNPANFLGGVISNLAAGIKAAALPDVVMNATQLVSLPYKIQKTIDGAVRGVVTPGEVGVAVDLDWPFTAISLPPVPPALETNLQAAITNALKTVNISLPGMPAKITIPDDAKKKIAENAVAAWRLAWSDLAPRLNLAFQELFKTMQIFQNPLALFLFSMPPAVTLGKGAADIKPVSVIQPGKPPMAWQPKNRISEVKAEVKAVEVTAANHELTAALSF